MSAEQHGPVTLYHGDCLDVLRSLPDASVDAVVTDPPYGLEFMGREWDAPWKHNGAVIKDPATERGGFQDGNGGNPYSRSRIEYGRGGQASVGFQEWATLWCVELCRVLKPGGHMLAFGGTRTWHRLACAVEDAGFEVRDSIAWLYGQGFPKSLNVSAALDAARCRCDVGEWTHGTGDPAAESQAEHGLRDVPSADVPPTEGTPRGARALLLPSLPEQGAPAAGRSELRTAEDGRGEPRMERRGDLSQGEGELRRAAIRPVSGGVPADGPVGRLHHGAPSGHGPVGRTDADPNGVREPQEPRPEGQSPRESGALPDQRRPQAWGGWPVCGRCSQPVIPDGLGTAAKPAFEPIVVARKPLAGTVAANVLAHGTGALNIDGCRTATTDDLNGGGYSGERREAEGASSYAIRRGGLGEFKQPTGRWPANVILDESQAEALDEQSGETASPSKPVKQGGYHGGGFDVGKSEGAPRDGEGVGYGDSGGASRFFFIAREDDSCSGDASTTATTGTTDPAPSADGAWSSAAPVEQLTSTRFRYEPKAGADERVRIDGTAHPTVKPLSLMRWLVRLVTPPGGTVLEPFAGSGTTAEACLLEGFRCIAIEREADYLPLIRQRLNRRRDPVAAVKASGDDGGLFDLLDGGAA